MINKLVFPFIKKYLKLVIGIIVASALSFCMIFSIVFSCDSVKTSLDGFVKDYKYSDAYFYTNVVDKDIINKVVNIDGVKSANTKLIFDVNTKLKNGRYVTLRISSYGLRDYSLLHTYKINECQDYPNIAISKKFLDDNYIDVGELVDLKIGNQDITFCLGRAITTPECVNLFANEYATTFSVDLGYSYIHEDYFVDTEYYEKTNCITVLFEDWVDKNETFDKVKKALGNDYVDGYIYENSEIKKAIDENIEPLKKASYLLSISFLIIVSCVTFLFLTQIINQSKKDIAILRTLGYQIKDIYKLFSKMILVANIISLIIGSIIGFVVLNVVIDIYLGIYSIPIVKYSFNWLVFVLAIVLIIGSGQLSVLLSIRGIKKISPKDCFGAETEIENKNDLAIYNKLNRFSTRTKYGFISIIKNKKRFVFSTFCITCVVILILAAFAFYDSKNILKYSCFDVRMNYDYEVFFKKDINESFIKDCENSSHVSVSEKNCYKNTEVSFNGLSSDEQLIGIVENNNLNSYYNFVGDYISNNHEIIINHRCAEKIKANIGDTINVENLPFKVVGIVREYQTERCYVNFDVLEELGNIDDYSIKLNCDDRDTLHMLSKKYEDIDVILDSKILKQGADEEYKIYDVATILIIVFALLIGYIIVVNTMQTNLQERKKELSVLRTIGYQISDISKIWLISTISQIVLSIIIGSIFGSVISKEILKAISVETRQYPFVASLEMYLYTVVIVVLFIVITHISVINSMKKWNLVEITKEKD